MKLTLYKFSSFVFVLLLLTCSNLKAQTADKGKHADPSFIQVVSSEFPITIDGKLDERDWLQRRYDYLVFSESATPGDITYTVTDTLYVKGVPVDTTTTLVRILHHGLDLYISLDSDDKSVSKWGGSWEGDGLFMKIKTAAGLEKEYKLFFNAAGVDPDIVFETNGPTGSGEGKGYKKPGTVINDTSQVDSGYTAELVIHLDKLGYTNPYAEVPVMMNIFDPDGYTSEMDALGSPTGSYFKSWWGSEWGASYRTLKLADPPTRNAKATDQTITLDGALDEAFWAGADSVVIGKGSGLSTGGWYMQWNSETNTYTDQSKATVKFAHKGTDLYVGVVSNDKSVCKWQGWEADGLFMWMTNKGEIPAPGARMEIKNMFFDTNNPNAAVFETSNSVPTGSAEGASKVLSGTVAHTESNGPDNGYSLEVVVHTDYFGYSVGDTVWTSYVIWDMDYSSDDAYSADTSDYAPNWWGTQWVDQNFEKFYLYRGVILKDPTSVRDERLLSEIPKSFKLEQNYPNPFNPTTNITYSVPENGNASLVIYDILGNVVETLVNKHQKAGTYNVSWDASHFGSGVYFYQLKTENSIVTKKLTLIK